MQQLARPNVEALEPVMMARKSFRATCRATLPMSARTPARSRPAPTTPPPRTSRPSVSSLLQEDGLRTRERLRLLLQNVVHRGALLLLFVIICKQIIAGSVQVVDLLLGTPELVPGGRQGLAGAHEVGALHSLCVRLLNNQLRVGGALSGRFLHGLFVVLLCDLLLVLKIRHLRLDVLHDL